MTVDQLLPRLSGVTFPADGLVVDAALRDQTVTAVDYDSRRVEPGAVFVAIEGQRFDGSAFARDAEAQGALLVVAASEPPPGFRSPWVQVADARVALAELAAALAGDPSHDLTVVGVTGTNGKTTTTYLLTAIFEAAGWRCGQIGSVGYRTGAREDVAQRTTPEAPDIQSLLREMVDHGCRACVMEVSSHALAMHRVDQIRFGSGVFSNLTRDHLDYHPNMTDYFGAKQRLFEMLPPGAPAVINLDDPYGRQLVETVARPLTYAVDSAADVVPERIDSTLSGTALDVRTPRGTIRLQTHLPGRLNVYNVLAATAAAVALEVPSDAIARGVAGLSGVPGRFEVVSLPADDLYVLVDYAHTDDALRAVLGATRKLCDGRLISVFGCGGDRDASKRPLMGAVAARLSDRVVLTSDNPRSEDPMTIIDEIRRGIESSTSPETVPAHVAIVDRAEAIAHAIETAEPGDAIVIAGKGHETDQQIGDERRSFDDRVVAQSALARRRARARRA